METLTTRQYKELVKYAANDEQIKAMNQILKREYLYDVAQGYISDDEPKPDFL